MKSKICFFIFFTAWIASGCSGSKCRNVEILESNPSAVASCYAESEGLMLDEMVLISSKKNANGRAEFIDSLRTDDYARSVLDPLRGKEYFEICYKPKANVLGGDVCYFIETKTGELISVHKGA